MIAKNDLIFNDIHGHLGSSIKLSEKRGDTATGKGFIFPLVISTSINEYEFDGNKKIAKNRNLIMFFIIQPTSLLHQNLTANLSIFHNLLWELQVVGII